MQACMHVPPPTRTYPHSKIPACSHVKLHAHRLQVASKSTMERSSGAGPMDAFLMRRPQATSDAGPAQPPEPQQQQQQQQQQHQDALQHPMQLPPGLQAVNPHQQPHGALQEQPLPPPQQLVGAALPHVQELHAHGLQQSEPCQHQMQVENGNGKRPSGPSRSEGGEEEVRHTGPKRLKSREMG